MNDKATKLLVTTEEAMEILSVGRTMIFALFAEGKIDGVKIGKRRLYKYSSLEKLAESGVEINTQDAYERLRIAKDEASERASGN